MGNKVGKMTLQNGVDAKQNSANGDATTAASGKEQEIETTAIDRSETNIVYQNPKVPEMFTPICKDNKGRLWPTPAGFMEAVQRDLEVREDDLWIVTFPKCGTSWITEIVDGIQFEGDFDKVSANRQESMKTMPRLEIMVGDVKERIDMVNALESPRTIVTHLPADLMPQDIFKKKCKVIVLMRNPKDVACSYFHFHRMNKNFGNFDGDLNSFLGVFLEGNLLYGDVFDYNLGWWRHRKDQNNMTIFYEDLKKDLDGGVRKVSKFMGKDLSDETLKKIVENCTFEQQKQNNEPFFSHIPIFDHSISPFFRSGKSGGWATEFTVAQNKAFDAVMKKKMGRSDLKFDFGL